MKRDAPFLIIKAALLRLAALPVVIIVRLLLLLASHRAVMRMMPQGRMQLLHANMGMRIGEAVRNVARWVPGASCLTQAMATKFLLAVRGYDSEIRIGIKRGADGAIEAHAWLMIGQWIVTGGTPAEIAEFMPLVDLRLPHR